MIRSDKSTPVGSRSAEHGAWCTWEDAHLPGPALLSQFQFQTSCPHGARRRQGSQPNPPGSGCSPGSPISLCLGRGKALASSRVEHEAPQSTDWEMERGSVLRVTEIQRLRDSVTQMDGGWVILRADRHQLTGEPPWKHGRWDSEPEAGTEPPDQTED